MADDAMRCEPPEKFRRLEYHWLTNPCISSPQAFRRGSDGLWYGCAVVGETSEWLFIRDWRYHAPADPNAQAELLALRVQLAATQADWQDAEAEWSATWPDWAQKIRARLQRLGAETDDDEGCNLPEALDIWLEGYEANCERAIANAVKWEAEMRERAAWAARDACLVSPDGGAPTEAEADMCDAAAAVIRALPLSGPTPPAAKDE